MYEDGNDEINNGDFAQNGTGVVQVKLNCSGGSCDEGTGVEVQYCMPIAFPGIDHFFAAIKKDYPCKVTQNGRTYTGVAISQKTEFGREPVEK